MLRRALLAAAAVVLIAPAGAVAAEPWQDAGKVTDGLFDAQTELVLSGPAEATKDTARARAAYSGELRDTLREADPAADRRRRRGVARRASAPHGRTTRRRSPPRAAARAPGSCAGPTR